ncbi:hypothetical protein BGX38DRAFT_1227861 [Terfezia claveryi]|nr:hypothetical protein BGX38DRAFT_1227861 [Terfezia claveryi]
MRQRQIGRGIGCVCRRELVIGFGQRERAGIITIRGQGGKCSVYLSRYPTYESCGLSLRLKLDQIEPRQLQVTEETRYLGRYVGVGNSCSAVDVNTVWESGWIRRTNPLPMLDEPLRVQFQEHGRKSYLGSTNAGLLIWLPRTVIFCVLGSQLLEMQLFPYHTELFQPNCGLRSSNYFYRLSLIPLGR